jgi:hypothetical protein
MQGSLSGTLILEAWAWEWATSIRTTCGKLRTTRTQGTCKGSCHSHGKCRRGWRAGREGCMTYRLAPQTKKDSCVWVIGWMAWCWDVWMTVCMDVWFDSLVGWVVVRVWKGSCGGGGRARRSGWALGKERGRDVEAPFSNSDASMAVLCCAMLCWLPQANGFQTA